VALDETVKSPDATRPLEALFLEHARGLSGAIRSILGRDADVADVKDVLQQAFLQALRWERRGRRADDSVAWIFVLTMNVARDTLRRERRRARALPVQEVDPMELAMTDGESAGPHPRLEHAEWLAAARSGIERLRDPEKEVFLLRVSAGRSFSAIAAMLAIPEGTAKTRMRSALQFLRRQLRAFAPEHALRRLEDFHEHA
jgi:RNA polymerase sigma-70 factor (ECF subfamily)